MTCASCVSYVEGALREIPGVSQVAVNLGTNKASLVYEAGRVKLGDMQRAVEDVGYSITTEELTLEVRGMTCTSCVSHVETALKEMVGVTEAVVNLGMGTARVVYIPGLVTSSLMTRAIREIGYEASERSKQIDALDRERRSREGEIKWQGRNLLIAGTVGMIVMIGTFYDMLGPFKAVVTLSQRYKP